MLFNTLNFLFFFVVIYITYWIFNSRGLKNQNLLLICSSYFFYGCWDIKFLGLLIFSTLIDYFFGLLIQNENKTYKRKLFLFTSIFINITFLAYFKYFNFFIESFQSFLSCFGVKVHTSSLNVILPVGISFYTFHGLSYIIDVYYKRINSEKNFINYSLFVCYFPLLVAGPIERANHLLPQIKRIRVFHYRNQIDGLKQILWGVFKKVVIADNASEYVNYIFSNSESLNGSTLVLGAIFFSFQIYGDFSGYSDIALGVSRLLGIELLKNFKYPYFSRSIAEFWRRWHISLSSWFKDYVYIPLGGSRGSIYQKIRNTFVIFILSGFWHGANWTFIFWGFLHALFFLPQFLSNSNRENLEIVSKDKTYPSLKDFFKMILTFGLVSIAWIFFRSPTIEFAFVYIIKMFSSSIFLKPEFPEMGHAFVVLILIVFMIIIEWQGRNDDFGIRNIFVKNKVLRYFFYYLILILVFYFSVNNQQFIYFQF
jgi:alginate O-acetyltransferase complex protein AlgI